MSLSMLSEGYGSGGEDITEDTIDALFITCNAPQPQFYDIAAALIHEPTLDDEEENDAAYEVGVG